MAHVIGQMINGGTVTLIRDNSKWSQKSGTLPHLVLELINLVK